MTKPRFFPIGEVSNKCRSACSFLQMIGQCLCHFMDEIILAHTIFKLSFAFCTKGYFNYIIYLFAKTSRFYQIMDEKACCELEQLLEACCFRSINDEIKGFVRLQ